MFVTLRNIPIFSTEKGYLNVHELRAHRVSDARCRCRCDVVPLSESCGIHPRAMSVWGEVFSQLEVGTGPPPRARRSQPSAVAITMSRCAMLATRCIRSGAMRFRFSFAKSHDGNMWTVYIDCKENISNQWQSHDSQGVENISEVWCASNNFKIGLFAPFEVAHNILPALDRWNLPEP